MKGGAALADPDLNALVRRSAKPKTALLYAALALIPIAIVVLLLIIAQRR